MFVDDPRSAVETAAGLVDDSSQALVAFVKAQQDSLRAAGMAKTRELRNCALPSSITVLSGPVSQISPAKCPQRTPARSQRRSSVF
jgi:hypothetical protein